MRIRGGSEKREGRRGRKWLKRIEYMDEKEEWWKKEGRKGGDCEGDKSRKGENKGRKYLERRQGSGGWLK